jgi:hypothetical protein
MDIKMYAKFLNLRVPLSLGVLVAKEKHIATKTRRQESNTKKCKKVEFLNLCVPLSPSVTNSCCA